LQRLASRPQFQAVLAGSIVARTPHFALHRVALDANRANEARQPLFAVDDVWLGAMVPKRWAKRAVTRNTIKRQVYAVSQDFESSLTRSAHVVRLRSGFDRLHFASATSDELKAAVRSELQQLFTRAVADRTVAKQP
jgi:ribonuclease P protein component